MVMPLNVKDGWFDYLLLDIVSSCHFSGVMVDCHLSAHACRLFIFLFILVELQIINAHSHFSL